MSNTDLLAVYNTIFISFCIIWSADISFTDINKYLLEKHDFFLTTSLGHYLIKNTTLISKKNKTKIVL